MGVHKNMNKILKIPAQDQNFCHLIVSTSSRTPPIPQISNQTEEFMRHINNIASFQSSLRLLNILIK